MSTAVQLAVTLAGWTGAIATVIAYGMVTAKRISPDSLVFQGLNIVGAGLLSISASTYGAWPSAVVNVIWVAIGVVALRAIWTHRTAARIPLVDDAAHLDTASAEPTLESAPNPTPELVAAVEAAIAPESTIALEDHTHQRNSAHRMPVAA